MKHTVIIPKINYQFVMLFGEKSSKKYLGNTYKFFEKRNGFAGVTTWQSSNIGCFFVAQF